MTEKEEEEENWEGEKDSSDHVTHLTPSVESGPEQGAKDSGHS